MGGNDILVPTAEAKRRASARPKKSTGELAQLLTRESARGRSGSYSRRPDRQRRKRGGLPALARQAREQATASAQETQADGNPCGLPQVRSIASCTDRVGAPRTQLRDQIVIVGTGGVALGFGAYP